MKITLDKETRAQLTDLRDQLKATLKQMSGASAEITQLEERQQKLHDAIRDLESDDSEKAASSLATKRVQLEQVTKKLDKLANYRSENTQEQLAANIQPVNLLRQFAQVAMAAVMPYIEANAKRIAVEIRPYFQSDQFALGHAYLTHFSVSLTKTYTYRFGDYGAGPTVLKAAIDRAEEILSGELKWTWDAKINS